MTPAKGMWSLWNPISFSLIPIHGDKRKPMNCKNHILGKGIKERNLCEIQSIYTLTTVYVKQ